MPLPLSMPRHVSGLRCLGADGGGGSYSVLPIQRPFGSLRSRRSTMGEASVLWRERALWRAGRVAGPLLLFAVIVLILVLQPLDHIAEPIPPSPLNDREGWPLPFVAPLPQGLVAAAYHPRYLPWAEVRVGVEHFHIILSTRRIELGQMDPTWI